MQVNDVFALAAGGPSPVGGAIERTPLDKEARRKAAHLLGHSRQQITNCYLGSAAMLPKPVETTMLPNADAAA